MTLGVRVEAPVLDEDGQDGGADVAVEGEADVRLALSLGRRRDICFLREMVCRRVLKRIFYSEKSRVEVFKIYFQ